MRRLMTILLMAAASLVAMASAAQAVVVNDQGGTYGVALVPGTRGTLTTAGIASVTSNAQCSDPWLSSDLGGPGLPSGALCWNGGPVMHRNETFVLTWDPHRSYWQTTRNYIEQFLRDVADGTGTLSSPYAVTGQYADGTADPVNLKDPANPTGPNPNGQARNASLYGGGCIDYGATGGSACQFGSTNGTGQGYDYPDEHACPLASGISICLTDSELRGEVSQMAANNHLPQLKQPEYTPLVVLLTPPGVQVCLDSTGSLCSANGAATAQFCSYHAQVQGITYVVQPWTEYTACDEPKLPPLPANPTAKQVAVDAGLRIVNPLSQGQIGAITNPLLNGWFASNGSEINDNGGCRPFGPDSDTVTVGSSSQNPYVLQREFSNAGMIQVDPNSLTCMPLISLSPTFVLPSAVNQGDVVELDGSTTVSSLIVPRANYGWDFGDGTSAVGPSVTHTYAKGGAYTVKLTVVDRGGNAASFSQVIHVLGATGAPVTTPTTTSSPALNVRIQLLPQGLRSMLRSGVATRVTSNETANGFVTLSISRAAAKRAHIKAGRGSSVVIGRGTVSGIKAGTVNLHLRLSRAMAAKLRPLGHVALTVRMALSAAAGDHLAIVAAGRY
jgi:hypothetical protein